MSAEQPPWRVAKVFICSTFEDMHHERDQLMRAVFPRAAEEAAARRVHLQPVDLRWGVTREESRRALSICLEVVEECRPFFIGLLGERYGWVPSEEEDGESITAREIRRALLSPYQRIPDESMRAARDRLSPAERALVERAYRYDPRECCWLRAPGGSEAEAARLAEALARVPALVPECFFAFRDPAASAALGEEGAERSATARARLAALKEAVRSELARRGMAPPLSYAFRVADGRPEGLAALGEAVGAWLREALARRFGDAPPADPEALAREAFVIRRTRGFVGREGLLRELAQRVCAAQAGAGPDTLCVWGRPGCGKSALAARFFRDYAAAHPLEAVVGVFVGATRRSAELEPMLERLWRELAAAGGIAEPPPEELMALVRELPGLLARVAAIKPVLLVFDALDQLDPFRGARRLDWLPRALPLGVAALVTTLPGEPLQALRRRLAPEGLTVLSPLDDAEARALVERRLGAGDKKLSAAQLELLLAKPEGRLPLFLILALEELTLTGRFARLEEQLRGLPETVPGLFAAMLERLESDHGAERTAAFFASIALGRGGLSRAELAELLAPPGAGVLSDAEWARLYYAARAYLFERGEEIELFHEQLRRAVEARYLGSSEAARRRHAAIAAVFGAALDSGHAPEWRRRRALAELPYQLAQARELGELLRRLTDWEFLSAKAVAGMAVELVRDWELAAAAGSAPSPASGGGPLTERERGAFDEALARLEAEFSAGAAGPGPAAPATPRGDPTAPRGATREENGRATLRHPSGATVDFRTLALLAEAAARELALLRARPECLLQALYNHGYWYDAPEARAHYAEPPGGFAAPPPWRAPGAKLHALLEDWRGRFEAGGGVWLRACRPPADPLGGALVRSLRGHTGEVGSASFSPDGRQLLTAAIDATARVWDGETGAELVSALWGNFNARCARFLPDGRRVASSGATNEYAAWVMLWDSVTKQDLGRLASGDQTVTGGFPWLSVRTDGRRLAAGRDRADALIIDLDEGAVLGRLGGGPSGACGAYSPDGALLACADGARRLALFDGDSHAPVAASGEFPADILCLAWARDGSRLAAGDAQGRLWVLDGRTLAVRHSREDGSAAVTAAAYDPRGGRLATGSADGSLRLWSELGGVAWRLPPHRGAVLSLEFSPDGARLASAGENGEVRLWRTELRGLPLSLADHARAVTSLSIEGGALRSTGEDGVVRLWDLESGQPRSEESARPPEGCVAKLAAPGGAAVYLKRERRGDSELLFADSGGAAAVELCALLPETRLKPRLLAGGLLLVEEQEFREQKLIAHACDLARGGELLRVELGIDAQVRPSPDGRLLATENGTTDSGAVTLELWDLAAGRKIHSETLKDEHGFVSGLGFSEGGSHAWWGVSTGYARADLVVYAVAPERPQGLLERVARWAGRPPRARRFAVEGPGFNRAIVAGLSADARVAVLASEDRHGENARVWAWELRSGALKEVSASRAADPMAAAGLRAGGSASRYRLVLGEQESRLESLPDGRPVAFLAERDPRGHNLASASSPEGDIVALGDPQGHVAIYALSPAPK